MILDAFSSDAIPVHLLTREALALYRSKLAKGGMIAFHISNRYIDLAPVLGALARDAGMVCLIRKDLQLTPDDLRMGKSSSIWGILAGTEGGLGSLADDPAWAAPKVRTGEAVWADDYSNILEHFVIH
jgi:hypothetical protein